MAAVNITVSQYIADSYNHADTVTILDTAANLGSLTAGQIGNLVTNGVEFINSSNDVISWDVSQWQAVPTSGLGFDANDLKVVFDTGANIAGLTVGDLGDLNAFGVTQINPSDDVATLTAAQYGALGGISLDQSADVTLADTGANISGLSAAEFGALSIKGFDHIDASDDAFSLSVDQALGLGSVTIDGTDTVTLADSGANIAALSTTQIASLGDAGITIVDATDNVLDLTVAQGFAGFLHGMELTDADFVTVVDTGANISAVDASDMDNLGADGFDKIDATDNAYTLSVAQGEALAASGVASSTDDVITVADTGANLAGLSTGDISALGGYGVDVIDSTTDAVSFSVAQLGALNTAEIGLTAGDTVTLFDTATNVDAITNGSLQGYVNQGVDIIDASDNGAYSFDVAGANIFLDNNISAESNDTVTVADTGANIAGLSASDFSSLGEKGFDALDASDDALTLSLAQLDALATAEIGLTGADTVTAYDVSTAFEALTAGQIAAYGAQGVDIVDASDNVLHLTVAQGFAGFAAGIELTGADVVTVLDTGANISAVDASDMDNLGADGFDIIDATDNAYTLSKAQADALEGSGVALTAADVVTVAGDDSIIGSLSAGDISGYGEFGIDFIHATDGTGTVDVAQASAAAGEAIAFTAGDTWTVSDTGANISGLSASTLAAMVADGIDVFDATDTNFNLSVDQYLAVAGHLTLGDSITLVDTGANIQGLSAAQFAALAGNGIDKINASDNVLALTVAQFSGLGAVTLAGGDTVTIRDTGANLATLNFSSLASKNVDAIDSTDNLLTLSYSQLSSLGSVSLAAGDTVTLADTSTVIQGLSGAQLLALGGKGIDIIDTTDNVLTFTLNQFNNLGAVTVAAGDVFTIADTENLLENMSVGKIGALNTAGVDFIDSLNGVLNLTAAQAVALNNVKATGSDTVSVLDTGANIAAMSAGQIGALAAHNIDAINSSTDLLTLTTGQFNALGTVALTGADTVTLADSGSLLAGLNFAQLAAKGVDILDATDNILNLTVSQYLSLGTVQLTGADTNTILDSGTALGNLTAAQIADLDNNGIDKVDSTTDLLTWNVAQFDNLGETGLTLTDVVTIADTGANLATLDAGALGEQGVNRLDATDNVLALSKTQVDDLVSNSVALTQLDVVTMSAGEASLEALTAGDLATYAAYGIDFIDSASDILNLTAAQASAMANTGLKVVSADDVTVVDSSANVVANLGALFGALASTGIDHIDLTDNGIDLTAAQATSLNGVNFDSSDNAVVVLDTGANISAMSADQLLALGEVGVDSLDATDDTLTLNVAQVDAILFDGEYGLTAGDNVTLTDTGAHIASLSSFQIHELHADGIDRVTLSNHAVTLDVGQFSAFVSDFTFAGADTVTVKGNGGDNVLHGGDEMDVFKGLKGNDVLDGGGGKDTITGGLGADTLTGGTASDTFVFTSLQDSVLSGNTGPNHEPVSLTGADLITDLTNIDVIDLSLIDADSTIAGDQAFHEVKKFTGHAGEMMLKYNAGAGQTVLKLDVDGDGHADSTILISGDHHNFDNFVL